MAMMEEFYLSGRIAKGINSAFIVLIPKKEGSLLIDEYRPISLIGSLYKILANVLASRFAKVVDSIISWNQSAFLKGRYILDGVVILNELLDEAKKKRGKRFFFKTDFARAYDSVEWEFIEELLRGFNFRNRWTSWIMGCIRSVPAAVLINGSPAEFFNLKRSLRQGDPLSPFVFLLVAEGLNLLINKAVEVGVYEPAEIGRNRLRISHLQYADDTIFIGNGKEESIMEVKQILRLFELCSGLKVNYHKCSLTGINMG